MASYLLHTITDQLRAIRAAMVRPIAPEGLTETFSLRRRILRNNLDSIESNRQELADALQRRILVALQQLPPCSLPPLPGAPLPTIQRSDPLRMCAQATPTARALIRDARLPADTLSWLLSDAPPPTDPLTLRSLSAALDRAEDALFALASQLLRAYGRGLKLTGDLSRSDADSDRLIAALLWSLRTLCAPDATPHRRAA